MTPTTCTWRDSVCLYTTLLCFAWESLLASPATLHGLQFRWRGFIGAIATQRPSYRNLSGSGTSAWLCAESLLDDWQQWPHTLQLSFIKIPRELASGADTELEIKGKPLSELASRKAKVPRRFGPGYLTPLDQCPQWGTSIGPCHLEMSQVLKFT